MTTTQTTPDLSISTTEHPNVIRLREGFAAFARGDLDHIKGTMTDDCVWTIPGTSPIAGTHRGWDEIVAMFGKLLEATEGTMTMELQSVLADDDCAVAIYDSTATVAGQTRTMRFVMIEEMVDGKASAVQSMAYDQPAADAHMRGEG